MGDCQSVEAAAPGGTATTANSVADNGHCHQRHARENKKNDPNVHSLIRVGSKVLKPSSDGDADTEGGRLQVQRASTYDHVHNVVLAGLEGHTTSSMSPFLAVKGVMGLRNLGNTCFMNSSLQCLSNTIPLTDYFLGYDYRKEINHDNFLGTKGQLVNAYTRLMKQLWLSSNQNSSSSSSLDPSHFYKPLVQFAPDFGDGQQHDSQELLAFLLDGIHEDLNRVRTRPYIEDKDGDGTNDEGDAILAWQNYLLRNRSIVVDLFQGQLRNTIVCSKCHSTKVKFEPFMYLSLPISNKTRTLNDCLNLYCETEYLTGDNQYYCSQCQVHVDASKKLDLWILPPILIVHLKRFNYRGDKIETPVDYPLSGWNLSQAVKSRTGFYPVFDLYAVSYHAGNLNGGHYTACCLNRFDEQWYEMNDSHTHKIHVGSDLLRGSPKAYCLFYNRVERMGTTASNAAITEHGSRKRNEPKVLRQSVDRPELWPHMQLKVNDEDFRSFRRSAVVANCRQTPVTATDNADAMMTICEENSMEA